MKLHIAAVDKPNAHSPTRNLRSFVVRSGDVTIFKPQWGSGDYAFIECFNWVETAIRDSEGQIELVPPPPESFAKTGSIEVCEECHTPSVSWDSGCSWDGRTLSMDAHCEANSEYTYCSHCDSESGSISITIGLMDLDVSTRMMNLTGRSSTDHKVWKEGEIDRWAQQDDHHFHAIVSKRVAKYQNEGKPKDPDNRWGDDYDPYFVPGSNIREFFDKHYDATQLWLTFPNVRRAS